MNIFYKTDIQKKLFKKNIFKKQKSDFVGGKEQPKSCQLATGIPDFY